MIQWHSTLWFLSCIISAASHMDDHYLLFFPPFVALVTPYCLRLPFATLPISFHFPLSVPPPLPISNQPKFLHSRSSYLLTLSLGHLTSWLLNHLSHFFLFFFLRLINWLVDWLIDFRERGVEGGANGEERISGSVTTEHWAQHGVQSHDLWDQNLSQNQESVVQLSHTDVLPSRSLLWYFYRLLADGSQCISFLPRLLIWASCSPFLFSILSV